MSEVPLPTLRILRPTLPSSGIPYESPPWGGMRPVVAVGLAALAFGVCFVTGALVFGKTARTDVEAVGAAPGPGAKLRNLGPVAPVPQLSSAIPAPVPTAAPKRQARRTPEPAPAPVVTPQPTPQVVATPFAPEPTPVPTRAPVLVPVPTRAAPKPTPRPTPRPTPVQTFDDGGQPSGGTFDDGAGGGP